MELHMMGIIGYSPTFGEGEFSELCVQHRA